MAPHLRNRNVWESCEYKTRTYVARQLCRALIDLINRLPKPATHYQTKDPQMKKWRKSSYSGSYGNCIETMHDARIHVRDSKLSNSPVFTVPREEWRRFLDAL